MKFVPRQRGQHWEVDFGRVDGVRMRRLYKTRSAAQTAADSHVRNKRRHGQFGLTVEQAVAYRAAMAKMDGEPLMTAVDFWLAHRTTRPAIAVEDILAEYMSSKEGLRPRTVETMRSVLYRLPTHKDVTELDQNDIRAMLAGKAPRTVHGILTVVSTFLNWCERHGWVRVNVAAQLAQLMRDDTRGGQDDEGEVVTIGAEDARRLLTAATGTDLLAYVTLGLFCGIRRAELQRLDWSAINLDEKIVVITKARSKTRARRIVEIADNAVEWLRRCDQTKRLVPGDFHHLWPEFKRQHGLDVPHNALRHTFATMHLAHHANEAKLQLQMGHTSAAMLYAHYRGLRTAKEAADYWSLLPPCA